MSLALRDHQSYVKKLCSASIFTIRYLGLLQLYNLNSIFLILKDINK